MSMRPPLAWELELLEACLRVLPDFKDQPPARRPHPKGRGRRHGPGDVAALVGGRMKIPCGMGRWGAGN